MANHFERKPGAVTLNGPVISGYGSLLKIGGIEVLVISPSQDHAEGVADFLNDHAGTERQGPASHLLIGQPPWYQNTTKDHDLQYALNVAGSKIDYMDGPPITRSGGPGGIPDCGEAGHAEGRCGNASCMPGRRRSTIKPPSFDVHDLLARKRGRLL